MKRYTVVCAPEAEDQLAEIWPAAVDRHAVTHAQNQIEKKLAIDPKRHGVFLGEGLWKIEVAPLREYFEISDPDNLVMILEIHHQ